MDGLTGIGVVIVVVGTLIRLVIPLCITLGICAFLKKLDQRWQAGTA